MSKEFAEQIEKKRRIDATLTPEKKNIENSLLSLSANNQIPLAPVMEKESKSENVQNLPVFLQTYNAVLTYLCRECQKRLYDDKQKIVHNGDRIELKISMCHECAGKNANAREDNDRWKKVSDNHLWKLTKLHFVVITHLCTDCLKHVAKDPENVVFDGDVLKLKISMCVECAKKNCRITNGLAPWVPSMKK